MNDTIDTPVTPEAISLVSARIQRFIDNGGAARVTAQNPFPEGAEVRDRTSRRTGRVVCWLNLGPIMGGQGPAVAYDGGYSDDGNFGWFGDFGGGLQWKQEDGTWVRDAR
ncbi:MAG: hypothetical protein ACTHJ6_09520 [Oryzihumus sp.]